MCRWLFGLVIETKSRTKHLLLNRQKREATKVEKWPTSGCLWGSGQGTEREGGGRTSQKGRNMLKRRRMKEKKSPEVACPLRRPYVIGNSCVSLEKKTAVPSEITGHPTATSGRSLYAILLGAQSKGKKKRKLIKCRQEGHWWCCWGRTTPSKRWRPDACFNP